MVRFIYINNDSIKIVEQYIAWSKMIPVGFMTSVKTYFVLPKGSYFLGIIQLGSLLICCRVHQTSLAFLYDRLKLCLKNINLKKIFS